MVDDPPLHAVARRGDVVGARKLLKEGADVHRRNGITDGTALLLASSANNTAVARVLVHTCIYFHTRIYAALKLTAHMHSHATCIHMRIAGGRGADLRR
jgi:hypothetical protein